MRRLSIKRAREVIDLAIKSLNLKVIDYQHDGFAIHGSAVMSADKLQKDLRAATGIAFTVKSYPDRTQLMGIIKEQTGSLTKSSAVDGRTFANSLAVCLPILGLVQDSRHCDTHFGHVMAGLVGDHIYQNCYGELEVFRGGAWVTEPVSQHTYTLAEYLQIFRRRQHIDEPDGVLEQMLPRPLDNADYRDKLMRLV